MSNKKSNQSHHMWLMLVGCLIMFGSFWFLTGSNIELESSWSWIILLVCPLMHLFMMKGHHEHDDED
ncbi:hypothetical protein JCM15060_13970 [Halanaerobaculum tunisiense]